MKKDMNEKIITVLPSITAILIGIIIGWYILFITNPQDSFAGIGTVLAGAFNEGVAGTGSLFYAATPIMLTGLAVGFSIKTGLFNIGASGQFTVGAFTAILIGANLGGLPVVVHSIVAIAGGVAAGAAWGVLTGLFKALFHVNEVISGIMLNYAAMLLVNLLIKTFVYDSSYNRSASVQGTALITRDFFNSFLPGTNINIAFFIAIAVAVIVKIVLDRTTLGYELKITGKNRFAGLYAGISDKKSIIITMAVSGGLAGLGGALMYLCDFGDHISVVETVLQQGFTGISIALLGMANPVGIIFASLFIAYITVGGNYLQLFSYTPEIVDMIVAVIVFCGALVIPIRLIIRKALNPAKDKPRIKLNKLNEEEKA